MAYGTGIDSTTFVKRRGGKIVMTKTNVQIQLGIDLYRERPDF